MARTPRSKAKEQAPKEEALAATIEAGAPEQIVADDAPELTYLAMARVGNFEWTLDRITVKGDVVVKRETIRRDVKTMVAKKLRLELARV